MSELKAEELKVGDLVRVDGTACIITKVSGTAIWASVGHRDGCTNVFIWPLPQKITPCETLAAEEYLTLARRTLDPDLVGDHPAAAKARRMYLTLGMLGEYWEWGESSLGDMEDEAGDVLWYLEQLRDEGPAVDVSLVFQRRPFETIKKAWVHGKKDCAQDVMAWCNYVREHLEACHPARIPAIRAKNIQKLARRYPQGFVRGGGVR